MKYLLLAILMFVAGESWGQVKLYRSAYEDGSKDSMITSGTDTLAGKRIDKKLYLISCEVKIYMGKNEDGQKKIHDLYFYFKHIYAFSLSTENNAIIKFTDGTRLELPYNGKYKIYRTGERAAFTVDPNPYLKELSTKEIKYVELETSEGSYNVSVPEQFKNKIKDILNALLNA